VISVGGGGAPTSCDRRRRQLKVGGGGVRWHEHIFIAIIFTNIEKAINLYADRLFSHDSLNIVI
jgi:hypothetical protein